MRGITINSTDTKIIVAWTVKNLTAMQETQETQIWSLRQEGLLEKGMVTYSSILAWRILWTEEPGGLQSIVSQRVQRLERHNWNNLAHMHMVFPAVMYGCESWTIKKAEHQKIDASELWCWRIFLRFLRRFLGLQGNQPWIFVGKINAEAETPTLATWWDNLMHWKRSWCWERLKAKRGGGNRGWDGYIASTTQWSWIWANSRR